MRKPVRSVAITDHDQSDYLEFLSFKKNSLKELLSYILLQKDQYEYNETNYRLFLADYEEVCIKYDTMCREILRTYAPDFLGSMDHEMTFDFEKKELIIYKKEEDN